MMLVGKVALVTGSTSGIGLGIATQLAKAGAQIIIHGRQEDNPSTTNDIVQKISQICAVPAHFEPCDLTKEQDIEAFIQKCQTKYKHIDILVNNAGMQHVSPIENFPGQMWNKIIALNLSAAFHTMRLLIPNMKKKQYGRIINMASAQGLVASINKSAYVAAKHGLVGITKTVALELAETKITCNSICPGFVLTPLIEKQIHQLAKEKNTSYEETQANFLAEKHPSKQFVKPEDLGDAVVFLCSPAAQEIRGIALSMDGGWTAR